MTKEIYDMLNPHWDLPGMTRKKIYWAGYGDYVIIAYPNTIVKLYYKGKEFDHLSGDGRFMIEYGEEWLKEVKDSLKDLIDNFQKRGIFI